ncbi:MAG: hypothetical protein A2Y10_03100 [Planctomycetes bacterium GWF2_41_51]|nr:MAG: hypothetical protein A2Y10_03100 [Planctomycetes bacterium GWF2_41_51]HBG26056.1 hypothetical protein [Phycisphaerales bacterium]
MKNYLLLTLVVLLLAAQAQALTIFQSENWNSEKGWIEEEQGSNDYIKNLAELPGDGNTYVTASLQRNNIAGKTALYHLLEGDGFPVAPGTAGGQIPECWMQFDVEGTTSGYQLGRWGLFNSSGDNLAAANSNYIAVNRQGMTTGSDSRFTMMSIAGAGSHSFGDTMTCRVKIHVYSEYNSPTDANTYADVEVWDIDLVDTSLSHHPTLVWQVTRHLIARYNNTFPKGLNAFGISNAYGTTANMQFKVDNFYFSTEGTYETVRGGTPPPPFAVKCTSHQGDFNGDCKVNFEDLRILADEWLQCPYIPARLCDSLLVVPPVDNSHRMFAQPESREVFRDGQMLATSLADANYARVTFTDPANGKYDGSLIFAFKLPEKNANQVISTAQLWRYDVNDVDNVDNSITRAITMDLYGLPYRPAATNPVITAADHYVGTADRTDAVMIQPVVVNDTKGISVSKWSATESGSPVLAEFLNAQYDAGAVAGDWVLLRFSPRDSNDANYVSHAIRAPGYPENPNEGPNIYFNLADRDPNKGRIYAQLESKQLTSDGVMEDYTVGPNASQDPNLSRLTYNNSFHDGGNLVLTFRMPEIPEGKVLSKAWLKFFYTYQTGGSRDIDLYGLSYRDGSLTAPILPGDPFGYEWDYQDYYLSSADPAVLDTTDASLIESDIDLGSVNHWVIANDVDSIGNDNSLAEYLRDLIAEGVEVDDWILLRFNPKIHTSSSLMRYEIFGYNYFSPNFRPYLEYQLANADEPTWQTVQVESPKVISKDGDWTIANGYPEDSEAFGCLDRNPNDTIIDYNNAELIVPFKFPSLAAGEYITAVEFSGIWGGRNSTANMFNVDLYGLPHRSSTAFIADDYWVGPYAPLPEDSSYVTHANFGTPLVNDIFDGFPTSDETDARKLLDPLGASKAANGSLRAAAYMNALKAAGATNSDYGFFRFNGRYFYNSYISNTITDFVMYVKIDTMAPSAPAYPATQGDCPQYGHPDKLSTDKKDPWNCWTTFADYAATIADNWMECNWAPASHCE